MGLGIVVLVSPNETLLLVAVLFGLQLIAAGVVRLVLAQQAMGLSTGLRVFAFVLGALTGVERANWVSVSRRS